jgi:hypothetical protein
MEQFIGCDAYKKFSVFVVVNEKGDLGNFLYPSLSCVIARRAFDRAKVEEHA